MSGCSSRGASWGKSETKMLIGVWGEEKIKAELGGQTRTKQVFEKIAQIGKDCRYRHHHYHKSRG